MASIFVAQAAGIHLSWGQQLLMMATLILTSKGVAGVPRATLVVLLATASTFHLPTEPIFVILGIDALMDMARTTVNVVGNCLASVVDSEVGGRVRRRTDLARRPRRNGGVGRAVFGREGIPGRMAYLSG